MKRFIKILFIILVPVSLYGQQPPVTNQYVLNPLSINPAFAGNRGALNIAAFYRRQWVGISGAPETETLIVDAPFLKSKLGLGLMIVNDKIGVTKETKFGSVYAYRIAMGKGNLALGLGAGVITTNSAWNDLTANDPGDENYLVSSRVYVVPDFKFGVYYSARNFYAGFSIPMLISYKFNYEKSRYNIKVNPDQYNYLLNTGYLFNLSKGVRFFPSTLLSYTPGEKLLYDLNAHLIINDRIWTGLSYRNSSSLAGLLQIAINGQIKVGYTYEYDFGRLGQFSNGTHEVMFRYEFNFNVDAVNPLIF